MSLFKNIRIYSEVWATVQKHKFLQQMLSLLQQAMRWPVAGLLGCLAGCCLESPKVLPYRISPKPTRMLFFWEMFFYHEVDTHHFLNLWACGAWLGWLAAAWSHQKYSPTGLIEKCSIWLLNMFWINPVRNYFGRRQAAASQPAREQPSQPSQAPQDLLQQAHNLL